MTVICNRSLVVEQAVLAAIKSHFEDLRLFDKYKNFSINATNKHPFAQFLAGGGDDAASLFPAVVVSEISESFPDNLANWRDACGAALTADDVAAGEGGVSPIEAAGFEVLPKTSGIAALREKCAGGGKCFGVSIGAARKATVAIEVWSENLQLKNELMSAVRLYASCNLARSLRSRFPNHEIEIFPSGISSEMSNNANFDFGVPLWGALLRFQINWQERQIVFDTDAKAVGEIVCKVRNYAKGLEEYSETEFKC